MSKFKNSATPCKTCFFYKKKRCTKGHEEYVNTTVPCPYFIDKDYTLISYEDPRDENKYMW